MSAIENMIRRPLNPLIAALISALVLVGTLVYMVQQRASILRNGTEIILKTAPIDPRDLMRGDYVRLTYEDISLVEGAKIAGDWPETESYQPIWLTLEPGEDGVAQVTALSLQRPEAISDAVHLKSQPVRLFAGDSQRGETSRIGLKFGIERYYVPEGEGLEIEQARNERRTTVAVRVSDDGEAQIARLMIDGKTLYEEPLY